MGKKQASRKEPARGWGSCCCLPLFLVAFSGLAIVALRFSLQNPDISESALRKILKLGGVPDSIFDHIQIHDRSIWYDIVTKGNLGLGEGYMSGKIDLDLLPFFFTFLNDTSLGTRRKEGYDVLGTVMKLINVPTEIMAQIFNQQTRHLSMRVIDEHYNSGNDVYEAILGPTMGYTCGYWRNATTLDESQTHKFDLIRRKLQLEPGMKVADLGMGWGYAAAYMAEHSQVEVTGVSLAKEQIKFATDRFVRPGLSINFVREDYRDHCEDPARIGTYDRVYSIGMLEHVGYQNYEGFFKCIKKLLKPDGLAVIHSIGEPDFLPIMDPFLDKYIFPGAVIPSLSGLSAAFENHFILEDMQNIGYDYARTLAEWTNNANVFFAEGAPGAHYPKDFQRMWLYYLRLCEALFELRINQLWQFVFSPRPTLRAGIERQI